MKTQEERIIEVLTQEIAGSCARIIEATFDSSAGKDLVRARLYRESTEVAFPNINPEELAAILSDFGPWLRERLNECGVRPSEFAQRLSEAMGRPVYHSNVRAWLGGSSPNLPAVVGILRVFGYLPPPKPATAHEAKQEENA